MLASVNVRSDIVFFFRFVCGSLIDLCVLSIGRVEDKYGIQGNMAVNSSLVRLGICKISLSISNIFVFLELAFPSHISSLYFSSVCIISDFPFFQTFLLLCRGQSALSLPFVYFAALPANETFTHTLRRRRCEICFWNKSSQICLWIGTWEGVLSFWMR